VRIYNKKISDDIINLQKFLINLEWIIIMGYKKINGEIWCFIICNRRGINKLKKMLIFMNHHNTLSSFSYLLNGTLNGYEQYTGQCYDKRILMDTLYINYDNIV
jgi:hypothetical protein